MRLSDLVLVICCGAAAAWDLHTFRIPNVLLLAGAAVICLLRWPLWLTVDTAAAVCLPLLFLPLLAASMIGAGDIKLLMLAGLAAGLHGLLQILAAAGILAAGWALFRLVTCRMLCARMAYLFRYISGSLSGRPPGPYIPDKDRTGAWLMHLAVPVFAAVLLRFLYLYVAA